MEEYITSEQILNNLANLPQLVFEVTDACNLKCKYCAFGEFYNDFDKRENKMFSVSAAKRLIDYLNQYWESERNTSAQSYMYISFYGGEPLMNFNFIREIVEYVEKFLNCSRKTFRFSLTTNAILLHRYIDYLVEHNFNILISLDGNKKNDSYRVDHQGNSSFERVVCNVDLLRDKYSEFFEKNVNFNSVFHNRSTIEEIYDFFRNNYNKIPSISELNNSGIRSDMLDEFNLTYRNSEESLLQAENYEKIEKDLFLGTKGYNDLAIYLRRYSQNYYRDYTDLLFDRKQIKYVPTGTCMPFSRKMFVTVNGKILPCERIGHQFYLGNVSETDIELNVIEIAKRYNAYFDKMNNQCSHCKNKPSCIQCMFNIKDIDRNPICYGFMSGKMMDQFEQQQFQFMRKHPEAYGRIMKEILVI